MGVGIRDGGVWGEGGCKRQSWIKTSFLVAKDVDAAQYR